MRDIKFRVWDGDKFLSLSKAMHHDLVGVQDNDEYGYELNSFYNFAQLEQFTGMRDKKGVNIYEGDIVKEVVSSCYTGDRKGAVRLIEWNDKFLKCTALHGLQLDSEKKGMNTFKYSGQEENPEYYFLNQFMSYEIDIVGNIHENPELLESK